MSDEINKEVIANVINSLAGAFEDEKTERVEMLKESIKALNIDWTNPEYVNLLHINRLLEHIDIMVSETYPNVSRNILHKIQFIYKHYRFIENNVESIVDLGIGCSADKSRWIIKAYIKYLVTGIEPILPERNEEGHHYGHPDFGTFNEWTTFIDGLIGQYYGGIAKSNLENTLILIRKQTEIKEELEKESKLVNDFVPTYKEKITEFVSNGLLTQTQAKEALTHYNMSIILWDFIDEIRESSLTDNLLILKIKEKCERV